MGNKCVCRSREYRISLFHVCMCVCAFDFSDWKGAIMWRHAVSTRPTSLIQIAAIGQMVRTANEHHPNEHYPNIQRQMNVPHHRPTHQCENLASIVRLTQVRRIWGHRLSHHNGYHHEHHQRSATIMAVTPVVIFMWRVLHTKRLQNIGKYPNCIISSNYTFIIVKTIIQRTKIGSKILRIVFIIVWFCFVLCFSWIFIFYLCRFSSDAEQLSKVVIVRIGHIHVVPAVYTRPILLNLVVAHDRGELVPASKQWLHQIHSVRMLKVYAVSCCCWILAWSWWHLALSSLYNLLSRSLSGYWV